MVEQTAKKSIRMSDSIIEKLDTIKDDKGFDSRDKVIEFLLVAYCEKVQSENGFDFQKDLDNSDFETLEEICGKTNTDYKTFAKNAIVSSLKKHRTQAKNKPDLKNMTLDEINQLLVNGKGRTYEGTAETRMELIIDMVINHNDAQSEKSRKWFVTANLIAKLSGSNRVAVNKFVEKYRVMIDDHNAKHELRELDNRKGIGGYSIEKFKSDLGL